MECPIVTVKDGSLRGEKLKTIDGFDYYSFLGIPYAAPPINELRFQDPQPCKPWKGVRDALKECENFIQFDMFINQLTGTEDSLYLNVATPSLTGSRPVMVWIHGGGFNVGSGGKEFYGPDYIVNHDVVFVSMNYRLGVFGFLNMGVSDCAGNQGLKDQIASLKWVQKNIKVFGGDPKNVTIFGESAGGASVHALCISPLATGLFNKAISQSGTIYCPWAYKHSNKSYAMEMVNKKIKSLKNETEVVNYLRNLPMIELAELQQKLYPVQLFDPKFVFGPTCDAESINPVFPEKLDGEFKYSIDVPIIIGYNSHEGIMFTNPKKENFDDESNYEKLLELNLYSLDKSKNKKVISEVKQFYFGNRPVTEKEANALVQLLGDLIIVNGVQHLVDLQLNSKQPTFFYRLSHIPEISITSVFPGCSSVPGTSHADDLSLLFFSDKFSQTMGTIKKNSKDELVRKRMTQMWTDFSKYGNPSLNTNDLIPIKWKPITQSQKHFCEINDEMTMGVSPGEISWKFWKQLGMLRLNFKSI